MMLVNALRSHRAAGPASLRVARPPLTLSGSLLLAARILWIIIASGALVLWFVEIPLYYHAALKLHNTNGMVNLRPAEWRIGLHQLGLSPSFYAAGAVAAACLQTWPAALIALIIFFRRSNE